MCSTLGRRSVVKYFIGVWSHHVCSGQCARGRLSPIVDDVQANECPSTRLLTWGAVNKCAHSPQQARIECTAALDPTNQEFGMSRTGKLASTTRSRRRMRQRLHAPSTTDADDRPSLLPPSPACTVSSVVARPSRAWLAVSRLAIALLLAYLAVLCFCASTTLQARLRPAALRTRVAPAPHPTSTRSMQRAAGRGALPASRLARVAALRSRPPRGGARRCLAAMDVAPPSAFRGPAAHRRAPAAHRRRGRRRLGRAMAHSPWPGVRTTAGRRHVGTPPARQRRGALLGQDGA